MIVGAGVAGYQAALTLSRKVGDGAEIVLVNPAAVTLPPESLPQLMTGVLDAGQVGRPLAAIAPAADPLDPGRSRRATAA
ncbi:hypothetical protein AB0F88_32245 [Streptosporangium sp. NPDC023963]|uniref:hypothetical protein n=1 Tax=Streptosporangium sp. NPDC023963 TaxID=3155608 RepID=UPI0034186095